MIFLMGRRPLHGKGARTFGGSTGGSPPVEPPDPGFPPVTGDAVFMLNPSAPEGTTTRAPGDVYMQRGNQFVLNTDTTKPNQIGVMKGPYKEVNGARIYPLYPEWVAGNAGALNEQYYLPVKEGGYKVVQLNQAIGSLPQVWNADPSTYDVIDDYERDLGVLLEDDLEQIAETPCTQANWDLISDVSLGIGSPNLIENQQSAIVTSKTPSSGHTRWGMSTTAGEEYTFRVIFRTVDAPSTLIRVFGLELTYNFNDNTIDSLFPGLTVQRFQWIAGGWVDITLGLVGQISGTDYIDLFGSSEDLDTSTEYAYAGIIDKYAETFEPICEAATRPADMSIYLSNDYTADWTNEGLDANHTIYIACDADSEEIRGGLAVMMGWQGNIGTHNIIRQRGTTSRWNSRVYTNNDHQLVSDYGSGELRAQHYTLTNDGPGNKADTWASRPGLATVSSLNFGGTMSQYMSPAPDSIHYGWSPTSSNGSNRRIVIRQVGYWNTHNAYDYETEFGPANYIGS